MTWPLSCVSSQECPFTSGKTLYLSADFAPCCALVLLSLVISLYRLRQREATAAIEAGGFRPTRSHAGLNLDQSHRTAALWAHHARQCWVERRQAAHAALLSGGRATAGWVLEHAIAPFEARERTFKLPSKSVGYHTEHPLNIAPVVPQSGRNVYASDATQSGARSGD
jgi:hypothetical protein